MITGLLGAKLGANSASHQATPGLTQPESLQVNGTSCGAWPSLGDCPGLYGKQGVRGSSPLSSTRQNVTAVRGRLDEARQLTRRVGGGGRTGRAGPGPTRVCGPPKLAVLTDLSGSQAGSRLCQSLGDARPHPARVAAGQQHVGPYPACTATDRDRLVSNGTVASACPRSVLSAAGAGSQR
jgi:hypothetical protein